MAGESSRFFKNGFKSYKAFLDMAGRTMLEGVVEPFGVDVEFFIITTEKLVENNRDIFLSLPANYKIITINQHKLGPAYSIHLARNNLPDNRAYFIAYCDVWWRIQSFKIEKFENIEAAIFVHREFHPHLIKDNFSAFCKSKSDDKNSLKEIKEKGSFTDDWMNEALSVGVFYCRDATLMLDAIEELIETKHKVANEFYPSMIFNGIVKKGHEVQLIDVDSFVHLGLPEHYKDFLYWHDYQQKKIQNFEGHTPINCLLLGGRGSRMKAVQNTPKHLLPLDNKTMLECTLERLGCQKNVIIGAPGIQLPKSLDEQVKLEELTDVSLSQLETMQKSLAYLPDDESILFSSCDCFGDLDWKELNNLVETAKPNCIVFSFKKSLLNSKSEGGHTTIHVEDGNVIDVDIKGLRKNYDDCLAGFFWFKNKHIASDLLMELDQQNITGEVLIDHLIKCLSRGEDKPKCIKLDYYIHVGTPNEYAEYVYWSERAKALINH